MDIIIIIIIIVVIVNKSKKKKTATDKTWQGTLAQGGGVVTGRGNTERYEQVTMDNYMKSKPQTVKKPQTQTSVQKKQEQPKEEIAETATMDFLKQKAEAERVEDIKEKKLAEYKHNKQYGHQNFGERYLLGDKVPQGKHLKICSYCGAENLVKNNERGEICCYFCHKKLK